MFGMNHKMLEALLKSQLKKLKTIQVEWEEENSPKKSYRVADHKINSQSACLILEEKQTKAKARLHVKL